MISCRTTRSSGPVLRPSLRSVPAFAAELDRFGRFGAWNETVRNLKSEHMLLEYQ